MKNKKVSYRIPSYYSKAADRLAFWLDRMGNEYCAEGVTDRTFEYAMQALDSFKAIKQNSKNTGK